jgi:serine/threonine protein kinase
VTASAGDRDLTGRQLGPYLLEAVVGEGAFGRVYRARHVELNVPRAVKVMRHALAADRRFRERFLREARMAARLDHPNIVSVHDFAAEAEVQYLVMEYVDSLTLAEQLTRRPVPGRLDEPVVQRWIREVAAALDHAHGLGIVHRDLKPANVLIRSSDQRAMLTDFGIAQALDEPSLTLTGVAMGTYAYMSPEQARGQSDLTSAADVYAFAAMLVEIATGEPPFGRGLAAVGGHLGSPVPTLDVLGPDLGRRVRAAVATGLAKDPADRVASAASWRRRSCAPPASRRRQPRPRGPRPRRRRSWSAPGRPRQGRPPRRTRRCRRGWRPLRPKRRFRLRKPARRGSPAGSGPWFGAAAARWRRAPWPWSSSPGRWRRSSSPSLPGRRRP